MPGNDPRFDDGGKLLVFDRIRDVNFAFGQQFAQLLTAAILSDQPDHRNALDKFSKVARNIGGSAGEV